MKRRSATIQAFGAFALYASAVAADGAAPPAPETRPDILASWQQEWTHLERRIADRRATGGRLRTVPVDQVVSRQALIDDADRDPLDVVLRRTRALLEDLRPGLGEDVYRPFDRRLRELAAAAGPGQGPEAGRKRAFLASRALQREIAFSNPLLAFKRILFTRERFQGPRQMMAQHDARKRLEGGSLALLEDAFGPRPRLIDVLADSLLENGPNRGSRFSVVSSGRFMAPDLSYDGTEVLFSHHDRTDGGRGGWNIYRVRIDGTGLRRLTADGLGNRDAFWLPDGRVGFVSDRRGGHSRCGGETLTTATLHSMKADGSDVVRLSYHETNDLFPSVDNAGLIVYTRWDYLDRVALFFMNFWRCYPDGRDPRSSHNNYPHPWTTLDGLDDYNRRVRPPAAEKATASSRPWGETHIRAIPGSPRYVATAASHHNRSFGPLMLIDPRIVDDGNVSQIAVLTPDSDYFPEAQGLSMGPYGTAWPLSETYYLCAYEPASAPTKIGAGLDYRNFGLYLIDAFGNRELIHVDPAEGMQCLDPIPVRPRPAPPRISPLTWDGERAGGADHRRAVISVQNIHDSDAPWPPDLKAKWLRIVQIFPNNNGGNTIISSPADSGGIARMSLGIAPVEEDGSVYCEAPVGKEIYFQALDENKLAITSMRSGTYVHPGEHLSCAGCHEDKWRAPAARGGGGGLAFRRAPSKLTPDAGGVEPVNFYRLIQPVFTKTCTPCHERTPGAGPKAAPGKQQPVKSIPLAYTNEFIRKYGFFFRAGNSSFTEPNHAGSRTVPGHFGARRSLLYRTLLNGAHRGKIAPEDLQRIALWLDLNTVRYGAYEDKPRQEAGELVWPRLDATPDNPQGVEIDRLPPGPNGIRMGAAASR